MTASGTRWVLNDALAIELGDATLASAFLARWRRGPARGEETVNRRAQNTGWCRSRNISFGVRTQGPAANEIRSLSSQEREPVMLPAQYRPTPRRETIDYAQVCAGQAGTLLL